MTEFRFSIGNRAAGLKRRCLGITGLICFAFAACWTNCRAELQSGRSAQADIAAPAGVQFDPLPPSISVADGHDIRFRRLSGSAGLSQTRVGWVVQDHLGFMWFGTQFGLNRYDGYRTKVFRPEAGNPDSVSCAYIRSLFVDSSGTLWVGCDRFLDRFDPTKETFVHYSIENDGSTALHAVIERINEDSQGMLWLATERGLYRFDPVSGYSQRFSHDSSDPTSISGNRINFAAEDSHGNFWVAGSGGLDEFDRSSGKVTWHVPVSAEVNQFHEDRSGVFWISTDHGPSCAIATLNLSTRHITCHSLERTLAAKRSPVNISKMLESPAGTMWFGSSAGVLRLDREHGQIISYHNDPRDNESLEADDVIALFQDREGNIWACFQQNEPNIFTEAKPLFQNFTYQRGSLVSTLVTTIYEDRNNVLWIGTMGGLNRIDRSNGSDVVAQGSGPGKEILSILEDRDGVLFAGTFHSGLQKVDRNTGRLSPYVPGHESALAKNPIMRLMFDHAGTLWAATYGGVSRFDPSTREFVTSTADTRNTVQYQEIKEDSSGLFWLGSQTGLHSFDPQTRRFKAYEHDPNNPASLSDNRVNSINFDQSGMMWVGTQNGLDRFDPATDTFRTYHERDGLAGDVVSCILKDSRGHFWMSTNNGISSLDPASNAFQNFSTADGLPGPDLTGWGACQESPEGEMFFGGFSGATAFFPNRLIENTFIPNVVLTDFRLFGLSVPIGKGPPLSRSIAYTSSITLSHTQNNFAIEFSALSYFNAVTNRYRYKLDGLDEGWREVASDQRIASYTTLPAGRYTLHVQGATSRGPWSNPGLALTIEVLPPWWRTWWFTLSYITVVILAGVFAYRLRLKQIAQEFDVRLEERILERTRLAREFHDTLLQTIHASKMVADHAIEESTDSNAMLIALKRLSNWLSRANEEGRAALNSLRDTDPQRDDLLEDLRHATDQIASPSSLPISISVTGTRRDMHPLVREEVCRIACEAIRNAYVHSGGSRVDVELRYAEDLILSIADNGTGISPNILENGKQGHYGLRGMRERAARIGAELTLLSSPASGTRITLRVPAVRMHDRNHRNIHSRSNRLRVPSLRARRKSLDDQSSE